MMKITEMTWACLAAILILWCLPSDVQAQKTDVVTLLNGDTVTGEIKSLEFAELRYSTDSMGTVSIEWEEVVSLTSDQSLQVEMTSGTRHFGGLTEAGEVGSIGVGRGENIQELRLADVVRITPIETDEKVLQRFEGSVKFGFDTDKASAVTSAYLNADVRYRARTYLLGLDISSSFTDQPGAETTENQSIGFNYQRFRANRWYTDWFARTEKNDGQGLEQRLSLGAGLGRYLVQTNSNQLSMLVGLVATRETLQPFDLELPIECGPDQPPPFEICPDNESVNAEGKFSVRYLHRRNEPSSDIIFTTNVFPLLEDFNSFRSDSNLTVRREIIDDLYFDLSVYYTYLTDPGAGAEKDDYGVITSIGYSF